MSALVEKEAIEIAPPSPGFYSRLFVTPKVTGGWRPVIDLSRLNGCVELSSFHMETAQSVLQSLRPGDWMVSLDLQDAYLQVPVHPASRRYLRFCVGDAVYQFRALCFGLSSAPQVFTRVMDPVSSIMHRHGFRLLRYLDDWLVLGSTFQELVRARDFLLWLCRLLGIIVNPSKSSLVPTQTLDYLGMTLVTSPLRVFPTLKQVQKFSPSAGLLIRPLPSCVGLEESSGHDVLRVSHSSRFSSPLEVSPASPQCSRSSPARRRSRFLGRWLPQGSLMVVRRLPSSSRSSPRRGPPRSHSLLRCFGPRLGCCSRRPPPLRLVVSPLLALFHQPAQAVGHPLRDSGFSASPPGSVCSRVFRQLHGFGLPLEAEGHSLIVPECGGSRTPSPLRGSVSSSASPVHSRPSECSGGFPQPPPSSLGSEWTLCPQAVSELLRRWPATIDLFATSLNHCLPVYFSPMYDQHSAGHGCDVAVVGQAAGLCLPSLQPSSSGVGEGSGFQRPGADVGSSFLASAPLVPGPSGAASGDPPFPATKEWSSQTATLSSLPPEPVRLQLTAYHISGDQCVRPASLT